MFKIVREEILAEKSIAISGRLLQLAITRLRRCIFLFLAILKVRNIELVNE